MYVIRAALSVFAHCAKVLQEWKVILVFVTEGVRLVPAQNEGNLKELS
jgi:hypothetical protein